jgi:hypothetical protein
VSRLTAGFRTSDFNGARLPGIPTLPTPRVVIPGPVHRTPARSAMGLPMSVRYVGTERIREAISPAIAPGNAQRNVLPADVWITGNRYNKTALYRPPTAVASPTWRITNVTIGDIRNIEKLQAEKRRNYGK